MNKEEQNNIEIWKKYYRKIYLESEKSTTMFPSGTIVNVVIDLLRDLQQELNKKNKIIEEIKEYVKDGYYDDYIYGSHILDKIEELEKSDNNE